MNKELRIRVALVLLFFGFASSACRTATSRLAAPSLPPNKECAQGRPPKDVFPFFALQAMARTREVTVFGDQNARSGIRRSLVEEAMAQWNDACQHKLHIPHFVVDWEHDRPAFKNFGEQAYRTTISILYSPDEEAPYDPQAAKTEVANWSPVDNTIKMFGKCGHRGHRKMEVPCEDVLDSIMWQSPWGSMIIAHEVGHALGLSHDLTGCKRRGLMQAELDKGMILSILPEYCRLADDINNENSPCSHMESNSDEHPCNNP